MIEMTILKLKPLVLCTTSTLNISDESRHEFEIEFFIFLLDMSARYSPRAKIDVKNWVAVGVERDTKTTNVSAYHN